MALERISQYLGLSEKAFEEAGVFDAVVGIDSLFFIDPTRLKTTSVKEFEGSIDKVRTYYSKIVLLLRKNNQRATFAATKLIRVKELKGVGIGYGDMTEDGSAIGPELAKRIATSALELIEMGINDPAIFEVMGLFTEGLGPDRLSDSLIGILKNEIYSYTERIAQEMGIPVEYKIEVGEVQYILPMHPSGNKPLILLPRELLRSLPVAHSYSDIAMLAQFNDELRARFNKLLAPCFAASHDVPKEQIKEYIFASGGRVKALIETYQSCKSQAYDFENDPEGRYQWVEKARELVKKKPLKLPKNPTQKQLSVVVDEIIAAFKSFIETQGGWRGLYNDDKKALNERHARLFFFATAKAYQGSSNIDISPESNAGQGPVDFKISRGSREKIVVEVKLSKGSVEHGYKKQTSAYRAAEEATEAYYLVLKVTPNSPALDAILEQEKIDKENGKPHPKIIVVDALPRKSASKI
jgi:hypothetical protein